MPYHYFLFSLGKKSFMIINTTDCDTQYKRFTSEDTATGKLLSGFDAITQHEISGFIHFAFDWKL